MSIVFPRLRKGRYSFGEADFANPTEIKIQFNVLVNIFLSSQWFR